MNEQLKYLQIDTASEDYLYIKLVFNSIETQVYLEEKRCHLKKLIPEIKKLLENNNIQLKDLSFIALNEGPGSWTGLRIGFSTIKVLAYISQIKLIIYNNFELIRFHKKQNTGTFLIKSNNENYYFQIINNNQIIKTGLKNYTDFKDGEEMFFYSPKYLAANQLLETKFYNQEFKNPMEVEPFYIGEGVVS